MPSYLTTSNLSIATVVLSIFLTGCGRAIPELLPDESDQLYVQDVHLGIRCELISAIHEANRQAEEISSLRGNTVKFFSDWGVKYTLTLQVIENTNLGISLAGGSTNVDPSPGDTVATIEAGINANSKATRTETDQSFSTVRSYSEEKDCLRDAPNKIVPDGSSLGFQSWLATRLALVDSGILAPITEKESFTYKVQFDIERNANFTSKWSFIQKAIGSVGLPISGGRSTAHSVLVTFGPTKNNKSSLDEGASAVHNAILTGSFVDR